MKKNMYLGIMVVLGVWCLIYVGVKIDMWRLGYELEKLENQRVVLKREQEMLQVQLSRLTSPKEIARRAQNTLGLVIPQEGQIVMVSLDPAGPSELDGGGSIRLVREFSETRLPVP